MWRCNIETYESPATLVAIIVAARRIGDKELEREMRQRLQESHGVKLTFAAPRRHEGPDSEPVTPLKKPEC